MREIPTVNERPAGKFPTTGVTNELARAVQAMAPVLRGGPLTPNGADLFDVWLVWDSGPNGEANKTDNTYWLRRAYVYNPAANPPDPTARAQLKEVTSTLKPLPDWIVATNLSERPPAVGGSDSAGTHGLAKGTAIGPVLSLHDTNDHRVERYVFFSGGSSGNIELFTVEMDGGSSGDTTTRCSYTYTVYPYLGSTALAASVPITGNGQRIVKCAMNAGTVGMGIRSGGSVVLVWIDETFDQTECTTPP